MSEIGSALNIRKAVCIGCGVIGAGWAARLLWHGIDVAIADTHPDSERRCRMVLENANRALTRLWGQPTDNPGHPRFASCIADAVRDAEFGKKIERYGPNLIVRSSHCLGQT